MNEIVQRMKRVEGLVLAGGLLMAVTSIVLSLLGPNYADVLTGGWATTANDTAFGLAILALGWFLGRHYMVTRVSELIRLAEHKEDNGG